MKNELALGFAAQAWCEPETATKTMDSEMAIAVSRIISPLLDTIETAWGIIANANGGDWEELGPEWKAAAERWRDNEWHQILQGKLPSK